MTESNISIKRPQKKSVITLIVSAALLTGLFFLFYFLYSPNPQTVTDKILQALLFCFVVIGSFFLISFFINSIICLVAVPSIKIRNGVLSVIGNYDMNLSEISSVEEVLTKKGDIKKLVVKSDSSDNVITIKSHISDLPLSEVEKIIKNSIQ